MGRRRRGRGGAPEGAAMIGAIAPAAADRERAESERKAREAGEIEELLKRKEKGRRRPTILTGTAGLARRTLY